MTDGPYRDPPPPCEVCAAREAASEQMLPFVSRQDEHCPECEGVKLVRWAFICEGGGYKFYWQKKPDTFFRSGERINYECSFEKGAPKHFHRKCPYCDHEWVMLTLSETRAAGMEHT